MPVLAHTGTRVAPGDALFASAAGCDGGSSSAPPSLDAESEAEVMPGEGCVVHFTEQPSSSSSSIENVNGGALQRVQRRIVATRQGVAQWDGRLVSVFAATAQPPPSAAAAYSSSTALQTESEGGLAAGGSVGPSRAAVMGPRPGDAVHLRVTRLTRLFAFGEIIAVNWRWCSHYGGAVGGLSGVFKGVLRVEDIRPFRPTKDQLQPPAPTLAFGLGDVVLAEVISQSDAHQYQLSTIGDGFGVVESYVDASAEQYSVRERVQLQHIPGRRDAMVVPSSGAVVPRWCPLLP